jgi:SAM-dependent methyltransferase
MTGLPLSTESLSACPVCGSGDLRTVDTAPDTYIPRLVLQQCARCGVICLNPRLTQESVLAVEDASTVYDLEPAEAEELITNTLMPRAHYLASFGRSRGRRWLDIGCNRGLLLEAARRLGWEPVGVEIAPAAAQAARQQYGLAVHAEMSEIGDAEPFDVITAWHVLEHTTDPVGFLRAATARLAPGGVLALQVPGYDFRDQYAQRGQLGSLICAVHNFCFTLDGMRQVLGRTGLHPLLLEADPQHLLLTAICSNRPPATGWRERLRRLLRPSAQP